MHSDPIADMLARIMNSYRAGHKTLLLPHSRMKHHVAELLVKERYLVAAEVESEDTKKKQLKLTLRYDRKEPAISHLKRLSKPGLRRYVSADALRLPLNGYGSGIVSTSQGVMTYKDAKQKKIGGELICEMW